MDNYSKEFDLGKILNITSGKLFTNMTDVREVIGYLTGEEFLTDSGVSMYSKNAKFHILSLYPQLEGVGENVVFSNDDEIDAFVEQQKGIYGNSLSLVPMAKTILASLDSPKKKM